MGWPEVKMKRMCYDEVMEVVRGLIEESRTDCSVAAAALRDLSRELDPGHSELTEGAEE